MKKIITLCVLAATSLSGYAQLDAAFQKDTVIVERDPENDVTLYLAVNISGLNAAGGAANSVQFAIDASATTMPANGYSFTALLIPVGTGISRVDCPVTIRHGKNASGGTFYIVVQLSYNNSAVQTRNAVIKVVMKEEKKKQESNSDPENNRIMFLNAYNFDFGGTALASNYVGNLSFFAPSLNTKGDERWGWGFNTGIMKINYGQKDSTATGGSAQIENVLISPFDTIKAGLKYLREVNTYKSEKKNTIWSFYVQPTLELTKKSGPQHIYVHAHLELLASKWSATTTITNQKRDTSVLGPNFNAMVFRSNLNTSNTYTIHSLSGYFGLGFTFDLKPWDGGSFFFQPTIGFTSNRPTLSSVDINSGMPVSYEKRGDERTWRSFYLVRANYRHVLSKDATVVVGMDIRGLLPLYNPQYAAYIGLNVGLDSILGLIGGKKKE